MRVWLVLLFTLLAVLILAETGEAKKKKDRQPQSDVVDAGETPEEGGRRRGDRQRGKDKKGRKDRGRHNEEQTDVEVTGDADTPPADTEETNPEEPQVMPEPEPEPQPQGETSPTRRGKKGRKGGANPDKAARRAAKEERMQTRREKQAEKTARKEGSSARKEARKEAKRESKHAANAERKQARKEARKMERHSNVTSDCSEHSDCASGRCCQQRGPLQKCRVFNRPEGGKCFSDCVCAEGLECFFREGKQPRQPGGNVKGQCRQIAADEPATNQEQGQNEE
ncbi:draxin-like [Patiria miniata]|uniref:Uncharacterized protein n=1 Tax=Patiria miniata TaxID=46514 RepID=A0A914AB39_PATMI|nr:draxin-like [Patiria miniata]